MFKKWSHDSASYQIPSWMPAFRKETSQLCKICCLMYLLGLAANEEETQKKGLVVLWLDIGPRRTHFDRSAPGLATTLLARTPVRFSAVHICVGNSNLSALWSLVCSLIDPSSNSDPYTISLW
jgi:hypothetical protein